MTMEKKLNSGAKQPNEKMEEPAVVTPSATPDSDDEEIQSPITKETKKYPIDDEILDQIIEVIKARLSLPIGSNWNSYSTVKNNKEFFTKKVIVNRFGTFENAVNLALKIAEEKNIKLYYRKKE